MSKKYNKLELREFICNLIDDLENGEYIVDGVYGWNCMECKIKKVE